MRAIRLLMFIYRTPKVLSSRIGPRLAALPLVVCLAFASAAAAQSGARTVVALTEMANLETGLAFAELETLWLVPLEALNDLSFVTTPAHDFIDDRGGAPVMRPEVGLFEGQRRRLALIWSGPYVNYQPGTTQLGLSPYDQGSPLDPWGMPYLLFSPHGLMRGDSVTVTQEFYGDNFDRYAIVSLGPDRVMSADDLIRLFNGGVTARGISAIGGQGVAETTVAGQTRFTAKHTSEITVRGYRLGASQGASRVMFGGTELSDVVAWSERRVTVRLPLGLFGEEELRLEIGGSSTNGLALTVRPNAAGHWRAYR